MRGGGAGKNEWGAGVKEANAELVWGSADWNVGNARGSAMPEGCVTCIS